MNNMCIAIEFNWSSNLLLLRHSADTWKIYKVLNIALQVIETVVLCIINMQNKIFYQLHKCVYERTMQFLNL